MAQLFILILVVGTSVGAYLIGTKGFGLSGWAIRAAVGRMLECVGLTLLFFAVNLVVGVIAVLTARAVTGGFVSLYAASDLSLLGLSLLQPSHRPTRTEGREMKLTDVYVHIDLREGVVPVLAPVTLPGEPLPVVGAAAP